MISLIKREKLLYYNSCDYLELDEPRRTKIEFYLPLCVAYFNVYVYFIFIFQSCLCVTIDT